MLKTLRIILAIISFVMLTLLFIDVTGFAASHWGTLPMFQLVPALLSLNLVVILILVVLTLILGRVYCSIICPLGVYQDIINRVATCFTGKKKRRLGRFRYKSSPTPWRRLFLGIFVLTLAAGMFSAVGIAVSSLIEPYSAFGRMMTWLVRPGAVEVNNLLADSAAERGSYAFAAVSQLPISIPLLAVAALTFLVVTVMAWRGGRDYCNTVCPVGTVLGYLSRYSWLKPVIDTDKCTRCGSCGRHCKASCIDTKNHKIDYSRCVTCFDCINTCTEGAITYAHPKTKKHEVEATPAEAPDTKRRAFLSGGVIVASALASHAVTSAVDGGLAPLKTKKLPKRETAPVPAGAGSITSLHRRCVACQLCITNCPNGVLRPSMTADGFFMQPVMDFTTGYCRPECTICADVCPTGAIAPIDTTTKSSTKIGTAIVDLDHCISATYGQHCGNCATRCPAGAISMIETTPGGNLRPLVNESACIGCGSCEYHCPVGKTASLSSDYPAIHVEGVEVHRTI